MVAKTYGGAVHGVDARTIMVEVNVGQGTKFFMSGLPDNAVKESQHRVESALKNSGFFMPRNKTVVNLAPADVRKEGSAYDLSIAWLAPASGQLLTDKLEEYIIMGELTLDERCARSRRVTLAIRQDDKIQRVHLPADNAREAGIVTELDIYPLQSAEAVDFLEDQIKFQRSA